jgi:hypothetical protein
MRQLDNLITSIRHESITYERYDSKDVPVISDVEAMRLQACCFPDDIEKTFDRSFERFAEAWNL